MVKWRHLLDENIMLKQENRKLKEGFNRFVMRLEDLLMEMKSEDMFYQDEDDDIVGAVINPVEPAVEITSAEQGDSSAHNISEADSIAVEGNGAANDTLALTSTSQEDEGQNFAIKIEADLMDNEAEMDDDMAVDDLIRNGLAERLYVPNEPSKAVSAIFQCAMCGFVAENKKDFKAHQFSAHINSFRCEQCDYSTDAQSKLDRHFARTHIAVVNSTCDRCDYQVKDSADLEQHKMLEHPNDFLCSYCEYLGTSLTDLKVHMRSHTRQYTYERECDLCDFVANSTYKLRRHRDSKHFNVRYSKFACDQCSFIGRDLYSLKRHKNTGKHRPMHQQSIGVEYPNSEEYPQSIMYQESID